MSQLEFLEGILPEGARYSLRLINKRANTVINRFYDSPAAMAAAIQQGFAVGTDIYYVTAGFGITSSATAEHATAKRELYLDIDCGQNKAYKTKNEGLTALKKFCEATGLPKPTIVDSGNGLHVHWIFTSAVPVHKWTEVAGRLKALCKEQDLQADSVCTADVVRVLRVPDTINCKNNTEVKLLTKVAHYDFGKILGVISKVLVPSDDLFTKARALPKTITGTGLTKILSDGDPNRVSKFHTIWIKSINGTGCAQIKYAIENAATLSEPLWRAALSIAQHCEDRDWAIHELSKDHPNYSPQETETKAALTKGPYICETFQSMDQSKLCYGCPHIGNITSPIQIGSTIQLANPEEKVIVKRAGQSFEIPTYPWPYARGQNGGVYIKSKKKEEGEDDVKEVLELVYPHDFYAYKRMRDSEIGDVIWVRLHLPNDGVRDFMLSQREVGAPDKMRDKLNDQGLLVFSPAQITKLQAYLGRSIQALQERAKAEEMHTRFGWTRNDTFIIGNREYTKKGVVYAPTSRTLDRYVLPFTPKGTLESWKRVADTYSAPEFDFHAFGLLSGFGSVLMHLSPENGGVVNFYSKRSGTGKTTILKMINSIFGDPRALMKDAQDTHMSKVHRMGVMNGIPVAIDEMTNAKPEEMSAMLYGSTQGRARDRMKAGENAERVNDITWKGTSIWSSNSSIEDRLGTIKFDPQGEMARVIEIHLRTPVPSDVLDSQKLFNSLADNYGHAGDIFLNYVVSNLADTRETWEHTRDTIYGLKKWTQTERYRLNTVICSIAAGIITNHLGITNFNIARIMRTITNYVATAGEEMRMSSTKAVETFAMYVNEHISNMLSIDSVPRSPGLQNEAYIKPKGALTIRYEPDTKTLFIAQRDFNRWCGDNFLNAREMRSLFEAETKQTLEVVKKRMGAGWDTDFGAVTAYCIRNAMRTLGLEENDLGST